VSQMGDLWLLGRHRFLCGPSTVATDVERVLGGVEPPLMVTDPPYGVNYDAGWRNSATINRRRASGAPGTVGGRALGKVENDDRADWRQAWTLFPGDIAYVWHPHASARPRARWRRKSKTVAGGQGPCHPCPAVSGRGRLRARERSQDRGIRPLWLRFLILLTAQSAEGG
jgi:hypothetical protein